MINPLMSVIRNDADTDPSVHCLEAEQSIIGGILLSHQLLNFMTRMDIPAFFFAEHQTIISLMFTMQERKIPIDLITLLAELRKISNSTDYARIKGIINNLFGGTIGTSHFIYYLDKLREFATLRTARVLLDKGDISGANALLTKSMGNRVNSPLSHVKTLHSLIGTEDVRRDWVIEGLIPSKSRGVLAGRPKEGKSWLVLQMAMAVATGRDFLGKKTLKGDVLYLSLEDNDSRMKARIQTIGGVFSKRISYASSFPNMAEGGVHWLLEWCKSVSNPRLIIIDTFVKFKAPSTGKVSSYEDDYAATQELQKVTDAFGCAVLLVHHTRKATGNDKMEEITGSYGFTGGLDNTYVLSRERGGSEGSLHVVGRDIENDPTIPLMFSRGKWSVLEDGQRRLSRGQAKIALLLIQGYSVQEIAGIEERTAAAIYQAFHRMKEMGVMTRSGRGSYSLSDGYDEEYLKRVVKEGESTVFVTEEPQSEEELEEELQKENESPLYEFFGDNQYSDENSFDARFNRLVLLSKTPQETLQYYATNLEKEMVTLMEETHLDKQAVLRAAQNAVLFAIENGAMQKNAEQQPANP